MYFIKNDMYHDCVSDIKKKDFLKVILRNIKFKTCNHYFL